ncbi:hypothetical protein E2C01_024489 [Portunus trituberculatus]|uniref:Uncharacterized protein n=1 Tax=Portunus trituberculatus TaxID=210409 RepID=A0A5B7EDA6_PORTR|nr:hypothetical protein [Portunus trituberculatus]
MAASSLSLPLLGPLHSGVLGLDVVPHHEGHELSRDHQQREDQPVKLKRLGATVLRARLLMSVALESSHGGL